MVRLYYRNVDLKCHACSAKNTQTKIIVWTVNSGHMGPYFAHRQKRMNVACSFILFFLLLLKSRKDRFLYLCHSSKRLESKNTFPSSSRNENDFFKKIVQHTFFLLYLWAKYEPILTDFSAQTVTLGANLLVKAQTISQNAQCALFFSFTKSCVYLSYLNFEYG